MGCSHRCDIRDYSVWCRQSADLGIEYFFVRKNAMKGRAEPDLLGSWGIRWVVIDRASIRALVNIVQTGSKIVRDDVWRDAIIDDDEMDAFFLAFFEFEFVGSD